MRKQVDKPLPLGYPTEEELLLRCAVFPQLCDTGTIEWLAGFHPRILVAHQANPPPLVRVVGDTTMINPSVKHNRLTRCGEHIFFVGGNADALQADGREPVGCPEQSQSDRSLSSIRQGNTHS